jgi:ABC-type lipoprotein release transport system permease subunit
VGIAAPGVIATRSVERRQLIGVLRGIGSKRRMVPASVLLESGFVAIVGTALDVVLWLLLARQVEASITMAYRRVGGE